MMGPERRADYAFPWVRVLSILLVMTIAVSALWMVIRQFDETNVNHDDPTTVATAAVAPSTDVPTTATPLAIATPEANASPEWPAGSLPAMLQLAPDRLADDSLPLNDVARYADIAGWMDGCKIATPTSLDDPGIAAWESELDNLAIPASLRERGLDPVWRQTYGFDLIQVEQVLIIGQAPDYVMIMRGSFDPAELQNAWVASGYQAVEVEGQTAWSLFPGDKIDLSAPASRPAMGTLNNVALLKDGTLVAAAKLSRLGSVLKVVNGDALSLADHDDLAPLLAPATGIDRLASAVISKGSLLQANAAMLTLAPASPVPTIRREDLDSTPIAGIGMPEVSLVVLAIPISNATQQATPLPGPDVLPMMTMMLVFDDAEGAEMAEGMISTRLARDRSPVTGEPYGERIARPIVAVVDGEDRGVVLLQGQLVNGTADWLMILSDRDLWFAFWLPEA